MLFIAKLLLLLLFVSVNSHDNDDFCEINLSKNSDNCGKNKYLSKKRYVLYDVNPLEGFNLRRDVYIRVAVFMKQLIKNDEKYDWTLVLPPWNNLYHWRSQDVGQQIQIPWGLFFDINSLNRFIPVIEMYRFIEEHKSNENLTILDQVYILQNDLKMFETGDFREKNEVNDCSDSKIKINYKKKEHYWMGHFWGYKDIAAKEVNCVTFHGATSDLQHNLKPILYSSYMFDHMEVPLHDNYGSVDFWRARRSMRYNSELYAIANEFRRQFLNSTDDQDKTLKPVDWRDEAKRKTAALGGGPYLAVHLRRRDFLVGRADSVPTIASAATQLRSKMNELRLELIFVSTDADNNEYTELKKHLSEIHVYQYSPSNYVKQKFKDGGIAIIDQIICSYARYFIGTHESTFTFRIQEDREIIGLPASTTFNRLCGEHECERSSQWEIVW